MTPWPALLDGSLRERALSLVEAERAATRVAPAGSSACMSSGAAGLALLHGYWSLQHGDDSAADTAFELAESYRLVDRSTGEVIASLASDDQGTAPLDLRITAPWSVRLELAPEALS